MASGGIIIVPIKNLKEQWPEVKDLLLDKAHYSELKEIEKLPNDISGLTAEEIIKTLEYFRCCDTPYIFNDYIIFADGDNLSCGADLIARAVWYVKGINRITTWT